MLTISVALVPYGDTSKERIISTMTIVNDGSSTNPKYGNYDVTITSAHGPTLTTKVRDHARKDSVWAIVVFALDNLHLQIFDI